MSFKVIAFNMQCCRGAAVDCLYFKVIAVDVLLLNVGVMLVMSVSR